MYKVSTSYMLPSGDTLTHTTEFQTKNAAEEFFDKWNRSYNDCMKKGKILEYSLVMTEIKLMITFFN